MSHDPNDPLAPFRCEPRPVSADEQKYEVMTGNSLKDFEAWRDTQHGNITQANYEAWKAGYIAASVGNEQLKASNAELLVAAKIALRTFLTDDSKVLPIELLESAIANAQPEQQSGLYPIFSEPERDKGDLEPDV